MSKSWEALFFDPHPFLNNEPIRTQFAEHIDATQTKRRITVDSFNWLIELLADPPPRKRSQKDYSRRSYVLKTFEYRETEGILVAKRREGESQDRPVVIVDDIMRVVEEEHLRLGHAGWDATWKGVSSRYCGILRIDVIFLLKRCPACLKNPRKQSRGQRSSQSPATAPPASSSDQNLEHSSEGDNIIDSALSGGIDEFECFHGELSHEDVVSLLPDSYGYPYLSNG